LLSAGRILCSHPNNVNNFLSNFIQTSYFSTNWIFYKLSCVFFELFNSGSGTKVKFGKRF
jgi:hypothetical protein